MNGTEQRARHLAVAQAQAQLVDQGLVIEALAGEIVKDRQTVVALTARVAQLQTELAELRLTAAASAKRLAGRIGWFEELTLWPRLRWFVRGR